jgi:hypothetical protein
VSATPIPMPARARSDSRSTSSVSGDTDVTNLGGLRWAVRAVLTLGVTASIAANVLHARPNLISQLIAAWPPLALLLTVELISRVPADRRWLAAARLIAAAGIAGIAAWVSYWHMAGVAARYGETGAAASYLLPISVDGLVVVASISLVEIAGRIRTSGSHPRPAPMPFQSPPGSSAQPGTHPPAGDPVAASPPEAVTASRPALLAPPAAVASVGPDPTGVHHPGGTTSAHDSAEATHDEPARPSAYRDDRHHHQPADADRVLSDGAAAVPPEPGPADDFRQPAADELDPAASAPSSVDGTPGSAGDNAQAPSGVSGPDRGQPSPTAPSQHEQSPEQPGLDAPDTDADARKGSGPGDRDDDDAVVPSDTAAAVAYWHGRDPSLHPADIAARIGRSERTVRRYWPPAPVRTANGHDASGLAERLRAS